MDPFDDFDDIPNFDLGVIDEIELLNMPIQSLVLPNERRYISAPPMIENNGRHGPIISSKGLQTKFQESVPKKTRNQNSWCIRVWQDRAKNRNKMQETIG